MKKDPTLLHKYIVSLLSRLSEEAALIPQENGWFSIDSVVRVLQEDASFRWVRENTLIQLPLLVKSAQIEIDGNYIRPKDTSHIFFPSIATTTPEKLFIAVKPKSLFHMYENGLMAHKNPLIFSPSTEKALQLGKRFVPDPILLSIYPNRTPNTIFSTYGDFFLADFISPEAIEGPSLETIHRPKKAISKPKKTSPMLPTSAGSFTLDETKLMDKSMIRYTQKKGQKKEIDWKKERRKAHSKP